MNWRKSSHSSSNGECVEVGDLDGQTGVRDSKDPTGPALGFTNAQWGAFTVAVRAGKFD